MCRSAVVRSLLTQSMSFKDSKALPTGRPTDGSVLRGVLSRTLTLWKQVLTAHSNVRGRCEVRWVKGKSAPVLKAVDNLAKAATQGPFRIDHGYSGRTFARRTSVGPRRAAQPFHAAGQTAAIRAYMTIADGTATTAITHDLIGVLRI
jgi:hypothetical protein